VTTRFRNDRCNHTSRHAMCVIIDVSIVKLYVYPANRSTAKRNITSSGWPDGIIHNTQSRSQCVRARNMSTREVRDLHGVRTRVCDPIEVYYCCITFALIPRVLKIIVAYSVVLIRTNFCSIPRCRPRSVDNSLSVFDKIIF